MRNARRLALKITRNGEDEDQRQVKMKNSQEIETIVRKAWRDNVPGKFVYRGMDIAKLKFPLDPRHNPFDSNRGKIISFFKIIDKILDSGVQFKIEEKHFGRMSLHDPRDLLKWSRRDLNRAEIDFTSDYQSAVEYSDCWQGSQLKQNIKSIASFLRAKRNNRTLAFIITPSDWDLINDISDWVNSQSSSNPIVIHLRREADLFSDNEPFLPLGPENQFVERVMNRMMRADEIERISIICALQDDTSPFRCSICRPLLESDIFKIDRFNVEA